MVEDGARFFGYQFTGITLLIGLIFTIALLANAGVSKLIIIVAYYIVFGIVGFHLYFRIAHRTILEMCISEGTCNIKCLKKVYSCSVHDCFDIMNGLYYYFLSFRINGTRYILRLPKYPKKEHEYSIKALFGHFTNAEITHSRGIEAWMK